MKFYSEWLNLPKKQFELLLRLRLNDNKFEGNKADMCGLMDVTVESSNKDRIVEAINALTQSGYITTTHEENRRNWKLEIVELDTRSIDYPEEQIKTIMNGGFSVSVAPVMVVKVLLILIEMDGNQFTQSYLGTEIGCGAGVVRNALQVLLNDFGAITRQYTYLIDKDVILRTGTIAEVGAFFNTE